MAWIAIRGQSASSDHAPAPFVAQAGPTRPTPEAASSTPAQPRSRPDTTERLERSDRGKSSIVKVVAFVWGACGQVGCAGERAATDLRAGLGRYARCEPSARFVAGALRSRWAGLSRRVRPWPAAGAA